MYSHMFSTLGLKNILLTFNDSNLPNVSFLKPRGSATWIQVMLYKHWCAAMYSNNIFLSFFVHIPQNV